MSEFVHLHLHTEYSLLDGACRVGEVLDEAVRLGMSSVAVTEHGNMFSSVVFHDQAVARGIKPILGCEVYVAPRSRFTKGGPISEASNHFVLLAETDEGYKNLISLVTSGYLEGFYYRPRIDKELLARHARGLIGLTACLKGEVPAAIRAGDDRGALEAAGAFSEILGRGNFFLELQSQGIEEQSKVNAGLIEIARKLDLPLVCTNDVHYVRRGDAEAHDTLLCIGTGKTVQERDRLRYTGDQFYLKSAGEMAEVFGGFPEALANTVRIGERCAVSLETTGHHLPDFEVPSPFNVDTYFEHVTREGFARRRLRLEELAAKGALRQPIAAYEERLRYEIEIIHRMHYSGYFLIVWDFIRYAREKGIPVGPGRGSAAGSLVAYALRITDVDPLDLDLLFERFLNPERISLPDIDIDFCERRRGEVIEYVTRKYGRENVAQIITFGTMKARAAVRDVGRALDIPYAEVDRVAKQIPPTLDMTIAKAIEETPALGELESSDERIRKLLETARRLEGMTRHASVHAAGVVIAPRPLVEFVPLYKGQRDEVTTQWSMKEIERIGLLKMDFLGLSTLTLLDDAVKQIEATKGEVVDLDHLPLDDGKTYQLFADGQTLGVFQFESSGMRDILRKARPQVFDDLIALNALYRPGPLRSGMIDDFIARKHGKVEITYELPQLEPILRSTYGVIAYQEQVMRIASELAGFTLGEADVLRKAMGKKNADVMQAQRRKFVEGAVGRGIDKARASHIFDLMEHFAGYGFNKSHAAVYALLAYRTAWLKANYPWHFAAALLTIESQNTDKLVLYLGECRERGIPVLPPDVNESEWAFTVTGAGVRFGLAAVKNAGEGAVQSILDARGSLGRIRSLFVLAENVDLRLVNRRVLESLTKAGAFDSIAPAGMPAKEARPRILSALEAACDHGNRHQRDRDRGQAQLFGESDPGTAASECADLPAAEEWNDAAQLAAEKEGLGLYLSGHPVERYARELAILGASTTAALASDENARAEARDVLAAGVITSIRALKTRKGDRMAVFVLEDQHGTAEVVAFPEAFSRAGSLIEVDRMVLVKGRTEEGAESARVIASEVMPVECAVEQAATRVTITLGSSEFDRSVFEELSELFARHKGECRIAFDVELEGTEPPRRVRADVTTHIRVRPTPDLLAGIETLVGAGSVRVS